MAKCIFCRKEGPLTREHIWADWLKRYIRKDMKNHRSGRMTVWRDGGTAAEGVLVAGDVRSRRVKCVCKACNEGWMGKLQEAAKPIVLPLIKGLPIRLGVEEQRILAGWVAMAAMCVEFGRLEKRAIAQKDRDIVFVRQVPPVSNWTIWIGRYRRDAWEPHMVRHLMRIARKDDGKVGPDGVPEFNTQTTTYTVGELFIHCMSSEFPPAVTGFKFSGGDSLMMRRIWPVTQTGIEWPPGYMLSDGDADRVSKLFFLSARRKGG